MELRPGYKITEVGPIPEGWDVSTVGQEFEVKLGKMLDSERNVGTLKPYLGNKAVQWGRIDINELATVPMSRADVEKYRLQQGDLLVCEGGEVGRCAIWDAPIEECYYQKALHRLRPLKGFDSRVMAAYLRLWSDSGLLANYVTQTSIAHLPREKFLEVPMPVPSVREQRAIAAALSDVDALLAGLDQLFAKKRDLKQAAMQQLLTSQARLPGFDRSWEPRPLSSVIADLVAGVSVNSVTGVGHLVVASGEPGILKTSCVAGGTFFPGECKLMEPTEVGRARLSAEQNSIIVSRMNTPNLVGEVGFVDRDYPNLFLPDRLWMMRFRPGSSCCSKWLAYLLSSADIKSKIKDLASGTSGSMKNIAKGKLLALVLRFPSPDEQQAIATVLSDMDAELTALEARRDKTRLLKQAMMQELLTGRTRLI